MTCHVIYALPVCLLPTLATQQSHKLVETKPIERDRQTVCILLGFGCETSHFRPFALPHSLFLSQLYRYPMSSYMPVVQACMHEFMHKCRFILSYHHAIISSCKTIYALVYLFVCKILHNFKEEFTKQ